jgi:hypothetical protein
LLSAQQWSPELPVLYTITRSRNTPASRLNNRLRMTRLINKVQPMHRYNSSTPHPRPRNMRHRAQAPADDLTAKLQQSPLHASGVSLTIEFAAAKRVASWLI